MNTPWTDPSARWWFKLPQPKAEPPMSEQPEPVKVAPEWHVALNAACGPIGDDLWGVAVCGASTTSQATTFTKNPPDADALCRSCYERWPEGQVHP